MTAEYSPDVGDCNWVFLPSTYCLFILYYLSEKAIKSAAFMLEETKPDLKVPSKMTIVLEKIWLSSTFLKGKMISLENNYGRGHIFISHCLSIYIEILLSSDKKSFEDFL